MSGHTKEHPRPSRGRPRGEISQTVLQLIEQHGPLTARQVAQMACITSNAAWYTCSRLLASGQIRRSPDPVRLEGVNRPVARYEATKNQHIHPGQQLQYVWSRS